MTAGIVLAGGRSSRFGSDKLRVPLADGRPLLAHAVAPVVAVCTTVAIVIGPDAAVLDGLPGGLVIVTDPELFGGPVVGLLAGLEALALPGRDVVLVTGGDMPTVDGEVLRLLQDTLRTAELFDCARLGIETSALIGSSAVMPCVVRSGPALAAAHACLAAGDRRLRGLLGRLSTVTVPTSTWRALDPEGVTLRDIDQPADLPAVARDPRTKE